MPLRILEVVFPKAHAAEALTTLDKHTVVDRWQVPALEGRMGLRILVDQEAAEAIMDDLEDHLGKRKKFRVVVVEVEATLPRDPEAEKASDPHWRPRISREELYDDLRRGVNLDVVFIALAILSAVVAALGLIQDRVAVIIGAMVIAPLLGPNMALSLATTLADPALAKRALKTGIIGIGLSFTVAWGLGAVLNVDPSGSQIAGRTSVDFLDLGIAFAAGIAGALAVTTGLPAGVVGVMVAVALLPALVVSGLLFGSGDWSGGARAIVLLGMNLIAINLAGVATFLAQGIRPHRWWEAKRARKATVWAIATWGTLLVVLGIAVWWLQ